MGWCAQGFDEVQFVMDHLLQGPDSCTPESLRAQEEAMLSKLEVASGAVTRRVLDNYSDFVQGMTLVSELQSELTVSIGY